MTSFEAIRSTFPKRRWRTDRRKV